MVMMVEADEIILLSPRIKVRFAVFCLGYLSKDKPLSTLSLDGARSFYHVKLR